MIFAKINRKYIPTVLLIIGFFVGVLQAADDQAGQNLAREHNQLALELINVKNCGKSDWVSGLHTLLRQGLLDDATKNKCLKYLLGHFLLIGGIPPIEKDRTIFVGQVVIEFLKRGAEPRFIRHSSWQYCGGSDTECQGSYAYVTSKGPDVLHAMAQHRKDKHAKWSVDCLLEKTLHMHEHLLDNNKEVERMYYQNLLKNLVRFDVDLNMFIPHYKHGPIMLKFQKEVRDEHVAFCALADYEQKRLQKFTNSEQHCPFIAELLVLTSGLLGNTCWCPHEEK